MMHLQLSTRTRGFALLLVCAALTIPGLAAQAPAPAAVSAGGDPVVTVLSTGAEPRRPLRYAVTAGAKERVDMTMRMSLAMQMGDQAMPPMDIPPIQIGLNLDVVSVSPSGDIVFTFGFADMTMAGGAIPPGAADAIKTLTGKVTMSDRGVMQTTDFNTGGVGDPALKQLLASAGIEKLASPLPAEPLGIGARWQVVQPVEVNGMRTVQKTTFEVTAMEQGSVSLKTTTDQSAEPQKMSIPEMPAGAEISLVSMSGTGTGTLSLKPGALVLIGEMDVTSKVVMDVSAEGQQQRMATDTRMKMTLAPGKRQ